MKLFSGMGMLMALATAASAAGPKVLFDFETADQAKSFNTLDSTAAVVMRDGGRVLEVELGSERPYPNVTLQAPEGGWDLSAYESVEMDVTNLSDESIKIGARVDNPGGTGRANSCGGSVSLDPHETATLSVLFNRKFAVELRDQLEGMRYSPWGARGEQGGMIDPANVVKINLYMNKPDRAYKIAVDNIRAVGTYDPAKVSVPDPFFPFIDKFGQYIHQQWPNKIASEDDLQKARTTEAASMDSMPRSPNWDKYGGWADGPTLKATGHFYTDQHEGKWWLVDPEGKLFFSVGIDVVKPSQQTSISDRDNWFADAPWENGDDFKEHLSQSKPPRRGENKGKVLDTFDFYRANLQRKYGQGWEQTWYDLIPKRLMNWGFNTLGCWSDPKLLGHTSIPYTHWVYINTLKLPWQQGTRNRISDPFNPGFEDEIRRRGVNMTKGTTDDPYCIGYFLDNELSWGDETYLAVGVVGGEADQPAKQQMQKWLATKYGEIGKLNEAWGINLGSWDALGTSKEVPKTDAGKADLLKFNEEIVRAYFSTVKRVLKEIAPDKLYLGCRFAESNPQVVRVAGEYCDVVSFNLYRDTVEAWAPPTAIDKPVIIGEFHFGSTDQGVFGPGLTRAVNAADRAAKFKRYVLGAARNKQLIGAHWFQLIDEPTSGRPLDAENHNIGFLTITDTPYSNMIDASREVSQDLYGVRAGESSR